MSPFGITLYYTDSHPAGSEPFFTENELIENAQDIAVNQEDDDIIETAEEAMAYLENQGYGAFRETTQYFDRKDITFVDRAEINKPLTLLPYVKLDESERNANLQSFLKTYDDPDAFAKAFIEEEVKDTLEENQHIYQKLDGVETFDQLNDKAKRGFALGRAYTVLEDFLNSPLAVLLASYDLPFINGWLTRVQLKE